jgi:hypothetical protein
MSDYAVSTTESHVMSNDISALRDELGEHHGVLF